MNLFILGDGGKRWRFHTIHTQYPRARDGVQGVDEDDASLNDRCDFNLPLEQELVPRTRLHVYLVGSGCHSFFQLSPQLSFKFG
jgi:hypothetical protein